MQKLCRYSYEILRTYKGKKDTSKIIDAIEQEPTTYIMRKETPVSSGGGIICFRTVQPELFQRITI